MLRSLLALVLLTNCGVELFADPCPPGQVALANECRVICGTDLQCGAGHICVDQLCELGERPGAPVVTTIDGDSAADPQAPHHTGHHVHRRMTIVGEHLTGAAVTLRRDGTPPIDLTACSVGNNALEVELPGGLNPGEHVLSVATAAGSCNAVLPVLQGEPGSQGATGPVGPTGRGGPTGPAGPRGDTCGVSFLDLKDCRDGFVDTRLRACTYRICDECECGDWTHPQIITVMPGY